MSAIPVRPEDIPIERDRSPDGIGLGEFPNSQNAEDCAGDKRYGDNHEGDPTNDLRIKDAPAIGLQLDHHIGIFFLHLTAIISNRIRPN